MHLVNSFPAFSDLESQDWQIAMAMQFQEGDECQVRVAVVIELAQLILKGMD